MILTIKDRHPTGEGDFKCVNEDGKTITVDLFTDGSLPSDTDRDALIGKRVQVGWLGVYIYIAQMIELLPDDPPK